MITVRPLGYRKDGRPFYGFSGGEGEGDDGGDDGGGDTGGDSKGAPAGETPEQRFERLLAVARGETKAERDKFRPYRKVFSDLGITSPDQLAELGGKKTGSTGDADQKVDIEAVRKEAERTARNEYNRELVKAKIEARAAQKFADPEDAVLALSTDLDDFIGRDGQVDVRFIDSELDSLLTRKPHYGKQKSGNPPGFDGGARSTAAGGKTNMDDFLREQSRAKRGGR